MSCSSRTKATVGAALLAATTLGACSDIYYDRRETIALGADDAVASNRVTHMVDPWPRHSANNNIAFNGERMQGAVERYRTHNVILPRPYSTTDASPQQLSTVTESVPGTSAAAPSGTPAAAVKGP